MNMDSIIGDCLWCGGGLTKGVYASGDSKLEFQNSESVSTHLPLIALVLYLVWGSSPFHVQEDVETGWVVLCLLVDIVGMT